MTPILSKHAGNLLICILLTVATSASGQLAFKQKRISIEADPGTKFVTADFVATNVGKKPLKIVKIRTTCGCTTVNSAADMLAPGATTTIAVRMDVQIAGGRQNKGVIVEIDRAPYAYELTIEAVIPELLKVTPGHVTWLMGKQSAPRVVALIPDTGVEVESVRSTDPNFTCELRRTADHWQLLVTPAKLDKRRIGRITVAYRHKDKALSRDIPLAVISPPPPSKRKSFFGRLFSRD
jgi:hypothetical protein